MAVWSPDALSCDFRVFTEMSQVRNNLTHPRFLLTEEEEEADVIWSYDHIKDYR